MAAPTPIDTPPKKKSWLLPVLLLVAGVLVSGSYLAMSLLGGKKASAPPPPPVFMALDPFTVNLQPGGSQRHLHVAITVRVQDAAAQAQLSQYLPEVRSRVLAVLANREGRALMEPSARDALAEDIEATLKDPFIAQQPGARITSVMFTTFLLQ
jgi:flagellar protein FliL